MPISSLADSNVWDCMSCLDYDDSWTEMGSVNVPQRRVDTYLVYDSESDVVIMFGGRGEDLGGLANDTWAYSYDADTWTNKSPTVAPNIRCGHMMAYNSEVDRVILFSGFIRIDDDIGHVCYNDTWEYDYNTNTWTNLEPENMPTPRLCGVMAYDEQSDRVILFGGILEGTSVAADTWAYDYNANTWEQMNPASHPSARFAPAMAYNSEADRMILYGGVTPTVMKDTWAYHYDEDTWTNLNPNEHPTEAPWQMAYDAEDDLCVIFGGSYDFAETSLSSKTWVYDYTSNSWNSSTLSTNPGARCRATLAYDKNSDVFVLFGGQEGENKLNDTWVYDIDIVMTTTTTTTTTPTDDIFPIDITMLAIGAGAVVLVLVVVIYVRKR